MSSSVQVVRPLAPLVGEIRVPGDKSISHRALMFAALAEGESRISGLAEGEDVQTTARALESLGVELNREPLGTRVVGTGFGGLDRADEKPIEIDCGNSGTTTRLLMGILAGRRGVYRLIGDQSLSSRPMKRITEPLNALGANFSDDATLPLTVHGAELVATALASPKASAQVKSAMILAALQAEGTSSITVPGPSRDHTERMLGALGASIRQQSAGEVERFEVDGGGRWSGFEMVVPGDPSSAAFFVGLAACRPGSHLVVRDVSMNPTRLGFLELLARMGAEIEAEVHDDSIEPIGEIRVRGARLRGLKMDARDVTNAIDEIPLLATIATQAEGVTEIRGADELRHKESDRITATVDMLRAFGVDARELEDGLVVTPSRLEAGDADARHDHRIAMSAAVAAVLADGPSRIHGAEWVAVSYPDFFETLTRLGSGGREGL